MSKTITVNGTERPIPSDPRVSLLDFLRENEGLTGTKKGCDHGQCGACTVIVNGMRINSCLTLAAMHDGDSVTTIEGLGTPTSPSPRSVLKSARNRSTVSRLPSAGIYSSRQIVKTPECQTYSVS